MPKFDRVLKNQVYMLVLKYKNDPCKNLASRAITSEKLTDGGRRTTDDGRRTADGRQAIAIAMLTKVSLANNNVCMFQRMQDYEFKI